MASSSSTSCYAACCIGCWVWTDDTCSRPLGRIMIVLKLLSESSILASTKRLRANCADRSTAARRAPTAGRATDWNTADTASVCSCTTAWSGASCTILAVCSPTCLNNGTCGWNTAGTTAGCTCTAVWSGASCSEPTFKDVVNAAPVQRVALAVVAGALFVAALFSY